MVAGVERASHHELPDGTVMSFTSKKGNDFRVRLLPGVFEGHSRFVEVLEAPIKYYPVVEPTIMCVVPPGISVEIMGHAYNAAISTVGIDDAVYLLDRHTPGQVPGFEVKTMKVE